MSSSRFTFLGFVPSNFESARVLLAAQRTLRPVLRGLVPRTSFHPRGFWTSLRLRGFGWSNRRRRQPTHLHCPSTCLPVSPASQSKTAGVDLVLTDGGEGGIRTHGPRKRSTVFETAPFDHSGTSPLAERVGFEPTVEFCPTHDFQSCTFGHSVTSPGFLSKTRNRPPRAHLSEERDEKSGTLRGQHSRADVYPMVESRIANNITE